MTDLATFIVKAGQDGLCGTINAVGDQHTMESFFTAVADVAGLRGDIASAEDAWLAERHVNFWAGPRSLPLWLPSSDAGLFQRSNAAFRRAGGSLRPLSETIERVLRDEVRRGVSRPRRAGLTAEEESGLLDEREQ